MWSMARLTKEVGKERIDKVMAEVDKAVAQLLCNWDTSRTDKARGASASYKAFLDSVTTKQMYVCLYVCIPVFTSICYTF